ncbi:MAG: thioredoxin family protein [Bacteroidota bacterium]
MKIILSVFLLWSSASVHGQIVNQEIVQPDGTPFLVGKITLDGLKKEPYGDWFTYNYDAYTVDGAMVTLFKEALHDHEITLFLGTWCGDSKREVPRFLKILDTAHFPMNNLKIVALDRRKEHYKKSPTGEEKGWHIIKVPTIIFLRNGAETNRIVESPIESLEEDMATIFLRKGYIPNYAGSIKSN